MNPQLILSTAQYTLQQYKNWQDYAKRNQTLVELAKERDSNFLLLPEYAGLDLFSLLPQESIEPFHAIQTLLPDYLKLFQDLAQRYQIYILAGTIPVQSPQGLFYNRAHFFSPQGMIAFQDKIYLTPGEKDSGSLQPGSELKVFTTPFCKIGIAICYDSEFPRLVHNLVTAGADLILVPSCTDSMYGYNRVFISSQARVIENQCFIAQSCLLCKPDFYDFAEPCVGRSGIYSPIDNGFSEDGIIAQGEFNREELVTGKLIFEKLAQVRKQGQVRNLLDMTSSANRVFPIEEQSL